MEDAARATSGASTSKSTAREAWNRSNGSRPSSVASTSSSSSSSLAMGGGSGGAHLAASPGLLSPSLASALGIGPTARRKGGSPHGGPRASLQPRAHASHAQMLAYAAAAVAAASSSSSASCSSTSSSSSSSSSSSASASASATPSVTASSATSPSSLASSERRPSLPTMPSMVNRVSMMSVASFESLPEDESLHSFAPVAMPSSPPMGVSLDGSLDGSGDEQLIRQQQHPQQQHHHHHHLARGKFTRSSTDPTPVLPSAPLDEAQTAKQLEKRRRVAVELLETERVYVKSLRLINDNYYQPLLAKSRASAQAKANTPMLSRKALGEIFANFADILHLSQELLARLEDRIGGGAVIEKGDDHEQKTSTWNPAQDRIGDVLVPVVPFLKMYSLYVKNFSSALQRIEQERRTNDSFARWLRTTEQAAWSSRESFGFGLGFQAHLLTIVQRIPRYRMLVGDLLRATPAEHSDRADLTKALEVVEHVAAYIDDHIRQHEAVVAMLGIQRSLAGLPEPLVAPGRMLLRRATLLKACRKNVQPREFFLFSDCLIYASPQGQGSIDAAWHVLLSPSQPVPLAPSPSSTTNFMPMSIGAAGESIASKSSSSNNSRDHARVRTISSPSPFTEARRLSAIPFDAQQWQFRGKFQLQDLTVVGVDDAASPDVWLRHSLEIRTPTKSFAVYAESREVKEQWLDAIRGAREEWLSRRRTLQADEDSIEAKRERRRSLYQAARHHHHHHHHHHGHGHGVTASPSSYAVIPEAAATSTAAGNAFERARPASLPPQSPSMRFDESTYDKTMSPPPTPSHRDSNCSSAASRAGQRNVSGGSSTSTSTSSTGSSVGVAASNRGPGPAFLRILEDYQAPVWVPDSRADRCMHCNEGFGIWRRKHHCRLCGHVVCYACSSHTFLIASYEEGQEDCPARACDSCYYSVFPDAVHEEEEQSASSNPIEQGKSAKEGGEIAAEEGEEGEEEEEDNDSNIHKVDSDASLSTPATPIEASSPTILAKTAGSGSGSDSEEASSMLKLSAETLRPSTTDVAAVDVSPKQRLARPPPPTSSKPKVSQRPKTAAAQAQLFAPDYYLAFPSSTSTSGMLEGAAGGATTAIQRGLLSPQVQAATSGCGTFRLVTPRLTTPTDENGPRTNPGAKTKSNSLPQPGQDGASYFAGIQPGAEDAKPVENPSPSSSSSQSHRASLDFSASAQQQQLRKKRPLLSAKARLSTVYNLSAPNLSALGATTATAASAPPPSNSSPLSKPAPGSST